MRRKTTRLIGKGPRAVVSIAYLFFFFFFLKAKGILCWFRKRTTEPVRAVGLAWEVEVVVTDGAAVVLRRAVHLILSLYLTVI